MAGVEPRRCLVEVDNEKFGLTDLYHQGMDEKKHCVVAVEIKTYGLWLGDRQDLLGGHGDRDLWHGLGGALLPHGGGDQDLWGGALSKPTAGKRTRPMGRLSTRRSTTATWRWRRRPRTLVVKTLRLGNGQDPIGRDQDRRHGPCGALLPHGGGEQQDLWGGALSKPTTGKRTRPYRDQGLRHGLCGALLPHGCGDQDLWSGAFSSKPAAGKWTRPTERLSRSRLKAWTVRGTTTTWQWRPLLPEEVDRANRTRFDTEHGDHDLWHGLGGALLLPHSGGDQDLLLEGGS